MKVNVRVLAATNRNLEELCAAGKFRQDLFFRLNVFPITNPPLRERKGDIPKLVNHFVKKNCKKSGKKIVSIPQEILNTLHSYYWPGNIRELENVIERAVILSSGNQLQLDDWIRYHVTPEDETSITTLDEAQKEHILKALDLTQSKISGDSGAAKILGIKPTTLQARMKKLGISVKKVASN